MRRNRSNTDPTSLSRCGRTESLFAGLPPPNPERFRKDLRDELRKLIGVFQVFSNSISSVESEPKWPAGRVFERFNVLLEHYRPIARRREEASRYVLIVDINNRWPALGLRTALDRMVAQFERYHGRAVLAQPIASLFRRRVTEADLRQLEQMRQILAKRRTATDEDFAWMQELGSFVPSCCLEMKRLLSSVSHPTTKLKLRSAPNLLAQIAQEFIFLHHRNHLAIRKRAKAMREFIFDLDNPKYRKRLFGYTATEIAEWEEFQRKAKNRDDVRRFRQKGSRTRISRRRRRPKQGKKSR